MPTRPKFFTMLLLTSFSSKKLTFMNPNHIILILVLFLVSCNTDNSRSENSKNKSDQDVQIMELGDTLFLGFRENMTSKAFKAELKNQLEAGVLRENEESGVSKVHYSFFVDNQEYKSELEANFGNTGLNEIKLTLLRGIEDRDFLKSILNIYTKKYEFNTFSDTIATYNNYFSNAYYWNQHLAKEGYGGSDSQRFLLPGERVEKLQRSGLPCKKECSTCQLYMSYSSARLEEIAHKFLGHIGRDHYANDNRKLFLTTELAKKGIRKLEIHYLSQDHYSAYLHPLQKGKHEEKKQVEEKTVAKEKDNSWKIAREKSFKDEL